MKKVTFKKDVISLFISFRKDLFETALSQMKKIRDWQMEETVKHLQLCLWTLYRMFTTSGYVRHQFSPQIKECNDQIGCHHALNWFEITFHLCWQGFTVPEYPNLLLARLEQWGMVNGGNGEPIKIMPSHGPCRRQKDKRKTIHGVPPLWRHGPSCVTWAGKEISSPIT